MIFSSALPFVFACLVQSPFPFELKSGLSVEPFAGTDFLDDQDDSSLRLGLRLSWLDFDESDSAIAPEISFNSRTVMDDGRGKRFQTYDGEAGLTLYEVFNPFVIRFAGSLGVEYRLDRYSAFFNARMAGGYFFCSWLGLYLEAATRAILRDTTHGEYSYPTDVTTSLQFIF